MSIFRDLRQLGRESHPNALNSGDVAPLGKRICLTLNLCAAIEGGRIEECFSPGAHVLRYGAFMVWDRELGKRVSSIFCSAPALTRLLLALQKDNENFMDGKCSRFCCSCNRFGSGSTVNYVAGGASFVF